MSVSDGSVIDTPLAELDEYTLRLANLDAPEDRCSTLWKRGRGKRFSFIRPWAKREFVLDAKGKKLDYKAPAGDANGDTRGIMILDANSSVKPLSASNSKFPSGANFGFEILTSQDSLELACEDEATQRSWITALQLTIQQDIIAEAKIQKKIYDDHMRRKAEKEAEAEAKKEEEADKLLSQMVLQTTHAKVLEKQASSMLSQGSTISDKGEEVHEPSRESLEADMMLMGAVEEAKGGHVAQLQEQAGSNTTVMLSVDLDKMQEEVTKQQLAQSKREKESTQKKIELERIHKQMKEREMKANELRRKHQVRQNFRAAVKRAIIQHKFVTQLEDSAKEKATKNWHSNKPSKYDQTAILFAQGENSDSAKGIEKMLEKKKLERQLQLKMMCPPPPPVMLSYEENSEVPPPPPRASSGSIPPPPSAPKPPVGAGTGENVSALFNALPDDGTERDSSIVGPPSLSLLRKNSISGGPPGRKSSTSSAGVPPPPLPK
mmetsp:Transcript_25401/g.47737  ORF Transcript_25401/g.47737 Transcript_25401/m.47737 type:complete len:491 (-) Transcript_25401:780-2252(-)|eukprot:CAMPEP_0182496750 /NCGR_PEP_ID=MMETSP1321-20130603/5337_1 /TAXON_ID=91990 /ORGANISM="Bolidomonas sp., Strain RCC1657" /LENGTH=490 /DNA_ID=CAMNT_0024700435 /DNA_START=102 /DNA_END=1574 /DNA_ORIENTATION=+